MDAEVTSDPSRSPDENIQRKSVLERVLPLGSKTWRTFLRLPDGDLVRLRYRDHDEAAPTWELTVVGRDQKYIVESATGRIWPLADQELEPELDLIVSQLPSSEILSRRQFLRATGASLREEAT